VVPEPHSDRWDLVDLVAQRDLVVRQVLCSSGTLLYSDIESGYDPAAAFPEDAKSAVSTVFPDHAEGASVILPEHAPKRSGGSAGGASVALDAMVQHWLRWEALLSNSEGPQRAY